MTATAELFVQDFLDDLGNEFHDLELVQRQRGVLDASEGVEIIV